MLVYIAGGSATKEQGGYGALCFEAETKEEAKLIRVVRLQVKEIGRPLEVKLHSGKVPRINVADEREPAGELDDKQIVG